MDLPCYFPGCFSRHGIARHVAWKQTAGKLSQRSDFVAERGSLLGARQRFQPPGEKAIGKADRKHQCLLRQNGKREVDDEPPGRTGTIEEAQRFLLGTGRARIWRCLVTG